MAALEALALDTATPQIRAPGAGDSYTFPRVVAITEAVGSSALTLTGATQTASNPLINATQTWNNAATTFTGWKFNVTNTASAVGSLLADFQVGGTSQFSVGYNGTNPVLNLKSTTATVYNIAGTGANLTFGYGGTSYLGFTFGVPGLWLPNNGYIGFSSQSGLGVSQTTDLLLYRDAANTLAQRNGTNAQTTRIYNTYTDASNYERGKIEWATNVLNIGTENAGTGTARSLSLQTGGTSRLTIDSTGGITSSDLANAVGYKGTPLNEQSAAYTLVIGDMGKSIVHPATDNNARTFTIPANGTVAFPVGTTITFINMINTVTIAITTDTMYLAGAGTTGSRTLAAYGVATAVKLTSTSWIISGNGLT